MLEDLIVFQKLYDLILWIYPIINKFPQNRDLCLVNKSKTIIGNFEKYY